MDVPQDQFGRIGQDALPRAERYKNPKVYLVHRPYRRAELCTAA
jgi:hypothetical protein